MSQKCKLLERAVQVKEQVLEAVASRFQIRCSEIFFKFHKKTSLLESLFGKASGLKALNSFKKRLQHRCFFVKFAKFLTAPFFYRRVRSGVTVSENPEAATVGVL